MSISSMNKWSVVSTDIKYDPFHQDEGYYKGGASGIDSWTKSPERAKGFAITAWKKSSDAHYGIVLSTDAKDSQKWIDLDKIIQDHQGTSFVNFGESEVLTAFNPIPVSKVYIVKLSRDHKYNRDASPYYSVLTK